MKLMGPGVLSLIVAAACGRAPEQQDASLDASTHDVSSEDESAAIDTGLSPESSVDAEGEDAADALDAAEAATIDAGTCGAYESNGPYGCNKLLPPSTNVPITCVSEAAAGGGTIVDGYYELTSYAFDTSTFDASCATGATHAGIVMFCSGTMLWFDIDQNSSSFDSTGSYTTSGNTITISPLSGCDGNKDTYEYTATATTFEIRGGAQVTQVFTYTMK